MLKDLFEELKMQELYELCPNNKARTEVLKLRISLYPTTENFSNELIEFMALNNLIIGSGLKKSSPIQLHQEQKQKDKQDMAKEPNWALIGGLAVGLPDMAKTLEADGAVTITFDGKDLNWGEPEKPAKAPAKAPKKSKEPEEDEAPPPKKAKKKAGVTQEEFDAMYDSDFKDPEAMAAFAEEQGIEWDESPTVSINRLRFKKAVYAKFEW